jgi:hypothetical protein
MLKQALLAGAVTLAITFSGSTALAGGDGPGKREGAPKGQREGKKGERDGKKGERSEAEKKKMLEKYDKNGDGVLSEDEKAAAKADMEKRRAEKQKEGGDKGEKKAE